MTAAFLSSGDVIADRRASYAETLNAAGDTDAAIDIMHQTLELVPAWAAGWDLLGRYLEKLGRVDEAIAVWRHLCELDAEGKFGGALKLAVHGAAALEARTAKAYVQTLFDHYAEGFDSHLVEALDYSVPEQLDGLISAVLAEQVGVVQMARALDLGCGTGLMGARIRRHVSYLEGIDIAEGMVAQCGRKGIYDRVSRAEILDFLANYSEKVDLITAADVFIYCGALDAIFAGVFAALKPRGIFAFSVEASEEGQPLILQQSLRYAHGPGAIRESLAAQNFEIISEKLAVIRKDRGEAVNGYMVLARRAPLAEMEAGAVLPLSEEVTIPTIARDDLTH